MARIRVLPTVLLIVILIPLLINTGVARELVDQLGSSTRVCSSPSQKYRGPCIFKANCANVCKTEGFSSGYCRLILRSCVCTKRCPKL